jgi:GT2 family glycosyltransferase
VLQYTTMTDVELIISANGCVDHTHVYTQSLQQQFAQLGMANHLKVIWSDVPLGYSKANNVAISQATGDLIVLLNNDCVLLPQARDHWLNLLHTPFTTHGNTGISGVVKSHDQTVDRDFVIFFCVMIEREVFDRIGLLSETYHVGGCEDVEFCIEAEKAGFRVTTCDHDQHTAKAGVWSGAFPIYHKGQGTLHDVQLVPDYAHSQSHNNHQLKHKYN